MAGKNVHHVEDAQGSASDANGVASMRRFARLGMNAVLLTAGYYVAVRVGLGFRFQHSQNGVVWPANAVLMSALLLTPRRRWWLVFGATAVVHAMAMAHLVPAWRIAWQISANALFTAAMADVLRRVAGLPIRFDTGRQVLAYTAASFVIPAAFALVTPTFVRPMLHLDSTAPGAAFLRAFLSNTSAMLLVAPTGLLWVASGVRRLRDIPARRGAEAALIGVVLLAVGLVAFGAGPETARVPSLLLWVFPPLLWAAVRFGPLGASTSLFCVAALSVLGTARQLGPFVLVADADKVLSLQLFWIVLCPPVMLLAAVIRERERAVDDLHDQRNQLAHVTRVATVGELSGALAHELRQPLMSILANAQAAIRLLGREPVDLPEVRAILEDIAHQDKHAASVIGRLRSLLQERESQFAPLALETVVRDAVALGRSSAAFAGIDVETQIPSGLPRVRGDHVQLLQVMLNLVVNGCESMSAVPAPHRRLRLEIGPKGHEHVEVMIADRGIGLPAGGEDRVFDPFFTTKDKGLGLGLAIGRSIASAHGGRLWGENNPQGGATFHLVLPTDGGNGGRAALDRNR